MINDEMYGMASMIHNSALLLKFLVQDFIDLRKILKGELTLNYKKVDVVKECCQKAIDLVNIQIIGKNLKYEIKRTESTPTFLRIDSQKYL